MVVYPITYVPFRAAYDGLSFSLDGMSSTAMRVAYILGLVTFIAACHASINLLAGCRWNA